MILHESINRGSDACGETPQGPPKGTIAQRQRFPGKNHITKRVVSLYYTLH